MSYTEREVTVGELRDLYQTGKYDIEISTPDGFQKIGNWYDKGVLQMVRVSTPSFETTCAVNHLIQLEDNTWAQASELEPGAKIQTLAGIEPVMSVVEEDDAECYDFEVLHSNHRYYGDGIVSHNSGKSFICSGNIASNAQKSGCQVVLFDSENALDEDWLKALDVDTSPEKLLRFNVSMIDDVAKIMSEFMKAYKEQYADLDYDEQPKVMFIIDSLGMLLTPTDVDQFNKGDMKGDLGRKPKALTALVRNMVNQLAPHPVGLVATNHTYASQDMFDPDDKISGGQGFIYASSIVVAMRKLKLKEDEDGNKTSSVNGIRSACKVMKTRYAKPFESVQVKIPYESGMDPNSGLLELFEAKGVVSKAGNKLEYVDKATGEVIKLFRKQWEKNHEGCLDLVKNQWNTHKLVHEDLEEPDPQELVEEINES